MTLANLGRSTSVFVTLLFTLLICCHPPSRPITEEVEDEKKNRIVPSLEQAVERLHSALIQRDSLALSEITDNSMSYGHSSGDIQNKSEFINDVLYGPFSFLGISTEEQTVEITDGVGIVRHVMRATALQARDTVSIRIGNVELYRLTQEGGWKLLTRQAYKL